MPPTLPAISELLRGINYKVDAIVTALDAFGNNNNDDNPVAFRLKRRFARAV
ncbi:MAG: hypothetical protein Q9218_008277, partial [Villophora microphyllina]